MPTSSQTPGICFTTTRWSMIQRAGSRDVQTAQAALSDLCGRYRQPCLAFIRRLGFQEHDAEDLAQAFFEKLLEKDFVAGANREKGKFRTFLLTALKRFLTNESERKHAKKRGGGRTVVSMDQPPNENLPDMMASKIMEPDVFFDRQWALNILNKALDLLRREYTDSGRARLFESLKDCLDGTSSLTYAEIASKLRLTEPSVKMAVNRMRGRYREILRAEIAETVETTDEVDEEIRHLFAIFDS